MKLSGGAVAKLNFLLLAVLVACARPAFSQTPAPNVTPQNVDIFIEVDIRLKNASGGTVRLAKGVRFEPLLAGSFRYTLPCWNTSGACPAVTGMTIELYARFANGTRINITKFAGLCGFLSDTCVLPSFPAIQAKPGQAYSFYYSRTNAAWNEPPTVVPAK
jgi:hypothetical protein